MTPRRRVEFKGEGIMRVLLSAVAAAAVSLAAGAAAAKDCDHACLAGVADRYIAALVARDPSQAPIAPNVRFTENTALLRVGKDGFWVSASAPPEGFKIIAADPEDGLVGIFAAMKENGRPVIFVARLKVVDHRITEIQQWVQRDLSKASVAGLQTMRPAFAADVPQAERSSHAQMARIATSYFNAIEHNDGSLAPFADDCDRHESGVEFTNVKMPPAEPLDTSEGAVEKAKILALGCRDQVSSGVLRHISWVWPRGPFVIDRQKGLVMAFPLFVQRGELLDVPIRGVPGVTRLDTTTQPGETQGGEVMKISGGQIHEVDVAGVKLPFGLSTGWPASPRPKD
jgi:hypothetical protein